LEEGVGIAVVVVVVVVGGIEVFVALESFGALVVNGAPGVDPVVGTVDWVWLGPVVSISDPVSASVMALVSGTGSLGFRLMGI